MNSRDGVMLGVEVRTDRTQDISFGEDAHEPLAVEHQGAADLTGAHHRRRIGDRRARRDDREIGAHHVTDHGHASLLRNARPSTGSSLARASRLGKPCSRGTRLGARDLPLARARPGAVHVGPDPYAVLVSEVMLQQTQATRVAAVFDGVLARFPDVRARSPAASRADVLRDVGPARIPTARGRPAPRREADRRACTAGSFPAIRRRFERSRGRQLHGGGGGEPRVRRPVGRGRHERAPHVGAGRLRGRAGRGAGAGRSARRPTRLGSIAREPPSGTRPDGSRS